VGPATSVSGAPWGTATAHGMNWHEREERVDGGTSYKVR
jgi:hypothetical protein